MIGSVTDLPADAREHLQSALGGAYTLERELGRGGMATVWLAHDQKHKRLVALKVLHADLAASLGPDRFQREIEVAAGPVALDFPILNGEKVLQSNGDPAWFEVDVP